jgi:signal transduction histidine kinase
MKGAGQSLITFWRRLRLALRRATLSLGLTRRFLIVSVVVIAAAMGLLGYTVSEIVRQNIREGVARTAAASLDSLVGNTVGGLAAQGSLTDADRIRLDKLFEIGGEADSTRLLQIRIYGLDERLIYEASGDILDTTRNDRFALAKAGEVSSDIVELPLAAEQPIGAHPITLLRMYAPLHNQDTGRVFAVAALYYSSKSVTDLRARTQVFVWTAVLVIGVVVVALLYAFVASAERTSVRQSRRLTANLETSRLLSEQVRSLHQQSEQLRIDASDANEQLLARVGSDIHDGPVQLLTLAILQLTHSRQVNAPIGSPAADSTTALTVEAMKELRNISSGLVLPELAELTLEQTLRLAVARHEATTGSVVEYSFTAIDYTVESDIQVCLYRVVQEALSNAFRHAAGREQSVVAYAVRDTIALEVTNAVAASTGEGDVTRPKLGLRGMRLRLEAVGGSMTMEMRDDRAVVRAVVPRRNPMVQG